MRAMSVGHRGVLEGEGRVSLLHDAPGVHAEGERGRAFDADVVGKTVLVVAVGGGADMVLAKVVGEHACRCGATKVDLALGADEVGGRAQAGQPPWFCGVVPNLKGSPRGERIAAAIAWPDGQRYLCLSTDGDTTKAALRALGHEVIVAVDGGAMC